MSQVFIRGLIIVITASLSEMRTRPSMKERACFRLIQRYRKEQIEAAPNRSRISRMVAIARIELERLPPAPPKKNILALWSAYSRDISAKNAPPELIVGFVELLYGSDVVRDLDLQRMMADNYSRVTSGMGSGGGVSCIVRESFQGRTIRQLAEMLPRYE